MSRRRSSSSAMGPPPDRDVVMGPPPLPPPLSSSSSHTSAPSKQKDNQEIVEKYRKLKRRYFELEEKHKETSTELQRSGERNVKMREERNKLLDRIIELEQQPLNKTNGDAGSSSPSPPNTVALPASSAFPRTLLNARARTSFIANLRQAVAEDDADEDVDPLLTSRHVGPTARKRAEEEERERLDDEARDARRAARKGRSSTQGKGKEVQGPPLTPSNQDSADGQVADASVLVSTAGARLRIRPPAPPGTGTEYSPPAASSLSPSQPLSPQAHDPTSATFSHSYSHPPPPPPAHFREQQHHQQSPQEQPPQEPPPHEEREGSSRTGSPISPMQVDDGSGGASPAPSETTGHDGNTFPAGEEPTPSEIAAPAGGHRSDADVNRTNVPTRDKNVTSAPALPPTPAPVLDKSSMPEGQHDLSSDTVPPSASAASAPSHSASTSVPSSTVPTPPTKDLTPIRDEDIDPALMDVDSPSAVKVETPSSTAQDGDGASTDKADATDVSVKSDSSSTHTSAAPASSPATHVPKPINTTQAAVFPGSSTTPATTPTTVTAPAGFAAYPRLPGQPGMPAYIYPHPYAFPYTHLTPGASGSGMMSPGLYVPASPFMPPSAQRPQAEPQRQAKPKRLKAHTVTSKSYSIPMVPRDKKGKPMLPLNVGIMTVICLGDVCMREHFHTERYIFPVGYEVTRRYPSTVDPTIDVVYHCTILDGGDGPKFQIVPSDTPDRPVIAGTATGAWSSIVKQANAIRQRQHSNSVSGPDFFGLGQNTIKHLIQELPGADRLRDYVWQKFVEGGPLGGRHAAVIPALPEEYDASMPIGAYYPNERERELARLKKEASETSLTPSPSTSHYQAHNHAPPRQRQTSQQQQQQQHQQQEQQQQQQQQQHQQPQSGHPQSQPGPPAGVTQIVLPAASSETLNIQEYHPPPSSARRTTRASSGAATGPTVVAASARTPRKPSRSPSVRGGEASTHSHHTRSNSRPQPAGTSNSSPYLAHAPASSTSPPPVPATFASIMNAYPAPAPFEEGGAGHE